MPYPADILSLPPAALQIDEMMTSLIALSTFLSSFKSKPISDLPRIQALQVRGGNYSSTTLSRPIRIGFTTNLLILSAIQPIPSCLLLCSRIMEILHLDVEVPVSSQQMASSADQGTLFGFTQTHVMWDIPLFPGLAM